VTPRQPVVSGERLIKALGKDGWEVVASEEVTSG
jgi:predicted RNA binding protein YcfA (HicA-like mRNA interferase family)